MEKRRYGKTDATLSVVGFGGMVVKDEEPLSAETKVARPSAGLDPIFPLREGD